MRGTTLKRSTLGLGAVLACFVLVACSSPGTTASSPATTASTSDGFPPGQAISAVTGRSATVLSENYEDQSSLAFSGGKVAYLSDDNPGANSFRGPLLLGDVSSPAQEPLAATADVQQARVAGGPDGFVGAWVQNTGGGTNPSQAETRLVRIGLDGKTIWDVDITASCHCADVEVLKVAGQDILAGGQVYSWQDGRHLRQLTGWSWAAGDNNGTGTGMSLVWWMGYSWTPQPFVALDAMNLTGNQVREADLDSGTIAPPIDVYSLTTLKVGAWTVHITPVGVSATDEFDVGTVRGVGPGGQTWTDNWAQENVQLSMNGSGGSTNGLVGLGNRLYVMQHSGVSIVDVTTGKQLSSMDFGTGDSCYGPVPDAVVYWTGEGISWAF
jgi:hypothetical protein